MVAEADALEDLCAAGTSGQGGGGDLVVDAPTDVLGIRLTAVAPPGVRRFAGVGIKPAIDIDPALLVEHPAEPGAFFGQKARVLLVALPVLEVDLAVGDVSVAAEDDVATLLPQGVEDREEGVEEFEFRGLPLGR